MASSYKSQLPTINKGSYLRVEKVYWYQPINQADTFVIEDAAGNILWQGYCESANQSQLFDWSANPRIWSDFRVTNLASGSLEITLR